ncbi:hypothetical protein BDV28DRAFT_152084 [Aspergillus coremiiformis]|uniref:Uncharacterized protein n=1 Tax=Aspergillus coremiiformis TaxID=138285 RepID=A0A5N6YXT1_9EURO|nr:hypothetical protein BDV28DRAFT_152084 [Aspergillus coremiiformis]
MEAPKDQKLDHHASAVEDLESSAQLLAEETDSKKIKVQQGLYKWNALLLDTWFPEVVAMIFSAGCFVAIIVILNVFEGKTAPMLWRGVTLNAVISVLATASKCSLLYVMGQSIGQWKWVLLQTQRRRLHSIQTIDDASRGPWGSVTLLVHERCSILWLGAAVMVLALALDPSMQQIVRYSNNSWEISDGVAVAKQSLYTIPEWYENRLVNAMQVGIWSREFRLDPTCSSGNCTWELFTSVGFCNKCVDMTSAATLVNCNDDTRQRVESEFPCNVTLPNGTWSASPISIFKSSEEMYMILPTNVLWPLEYLNTKQIHEGQKRIEQVPENSEIIAIAHAQLGTGLEINDTSNRVKIKRVTRCAVSFCARNYTISVNNYTPSINVSEPDWGEMFFENNGHMVGPTLHKATERDNLCWKPMSAQQSMIEENDYKAVHVKNYTMCSKVFGLPFVYSQLGQTLEEYTTSLWTRFLNESNWTLHIPSNKNENLLVLRVVDLGLEEVTKNIAASLTQDLLEYSNDTVKGKVYITETRVFVNWSWIIFPSGLLIAGIVFFTVTMWASHDDEVSLWKASILPVLYHGMENHRLNDHHSLLTVSKMSDASQSTRVQLQPSDSRGGVMLR